MKKQLININPIKEQVKEKLLEKYDTTTFMNTSKIELKIDIEDILDEYIEQQHIVEPTIYITPNAYIKMRMLVDKTDKEVGWYGIVTEVPMLESVYVIEDIIVYPQKVTGATVAQDDDKMFEFEMSLTDEQVNHKRFHGHSHVNMTTSPSGVDENFYQDILSQVTDYFIITITNKRNEYTTRFYDVRNNILYEDVQIQLMQENGVPYLDWYDEQKELVQPEAPVIHDYPSAGSALKTTQTKLWEDDEWEDDRIWDPYLYSYVGKKEYKDIYGRDYDGEFDNYYANSKRRLSCGKRGRPKKGKSS